jgi:hypothetical protein
LNQIVRIVVVDEFVRYDHGIELEGQSKPPFSSQSACGLKIHECEPGEQWHWLPFFLEESACFLFVVAIAVLEYKTEHLLLLCSAVL